ncbi:hypothetical protein Phum_PHUM577320 [Pediculus humanus corporis]|uniref:Uncharacterized protein n=1 Tax=Pediculus humanus subsp. corporis TaxID=121224 RepID=E0W1H4_PEDHC|nr:uncharacterized protein Phum_PHUM577320 [Pediculus humanus corporis]EEB19480.1 hypothetical protein Phum_PHUM577320 [Pediculus humanus corporis]
MRDCISDRTVKELLERLCLAEGWLLKYLLGDGFVVRAAAANVKVFAKKNSLQPEKYFGDLYLIQNINNGHVSFKLYCPKTNQFVWSLDRVYDWNGYVDLKCNTHIFHIVQKSNHNLFFIIFTPPKRICKKFHIKLMLL